MAKRYTQADKKKALKNAKRRLKRFLEKNPTTFDTVRINEEMINALTPGKAIELLSAISVKNVNDNKMYKALEIISSGTNIYTGQTVNINVKGTVMKRKLFTAETERVKAYNAVGEYVPKLNLMGQPNEKTLEFEEKYSTPQKIIKAENIRNENALNNYMNNLNQMKDMVDSEEDKDLFKVILDLVIDRIETGQLTAKELNDSGLYKFSGINLFDSKVLHELRRNAKKVLKQLKQAFGIDDNEIINKVYPKFYEDLHDELYDKFYNEGKSHKLIEEEIKEEIERKIRDEIS